MKKFIVSIAMALTVLVGTIGVSSPAWAASPTDAAKVQVCQGVSGQVGGTCGTGGANLTKIIKAVLNILGLIAGIAGVIMIMVSGLKYITSGGDAQAVSSAKRSLVYAIVGLVVVAVSQVIVHFVLKNVQ